MTNTKSTWWIAFILAVVGCLFIDNLRIILGLLFIFTSHLIYDHFD